jgi:hypothetical protein
MRPICCAALIRRQQNVRQIREMRNKKGAAQRPFIDTSSNLSVFYDPAACWSTGFFMLRRS